MKILKGYTIIDSLNNIDSLLHLKIKSISPYNPQSISYVRNKEEYENEGYYPDNFKITNFDYYDQTIFYNPSNANLYININIIHDSPDFFNDIIKKFLTSTSSSIVSIDYPNITMTEIIDLICQNPNIRIIEFPSHLQKYLLTKPALEKLKNHNITPYVTSFVPELKNKLNYDFFLLSHFYERSQYLEKNIAILNSPIYESDFSYLLKAKEIKINFYDKENISQILLFLQNNSYKGIIIIKNFFNNDLSFLSNLNLTIKVEDYNFDKSGYINCPTVTEYLKAKNQLQELIKPLKNSELTPFEQFIYLYNLVKNYKNYKDNNQNPADARSIYNILDNEYMVCAGYTNILGNLCEMCNIPCTYVSCDIATLKVPTDKISEIISQLLPNTICNFIQNNHILFSLIEKFINLSAKHKIYTPEGHARLYVNLVDKTYGIDGYFYSDPTWDATSYYDSYNHLLFTDKENSQSTTPLYIDEFILFDITNFEDFLIRTNCLKKRHNIDDLTITKYLLSIFKNLDLEFYNYITQKYSLAIFDKNIYHEIVNHILSKTNKPISKKTKYEAIKNFLLKRRVVTQKLIPYYMYLIRYINDYKEPKYFTQDSSRSH